MRRRRPVHALDDEARAPAPLRGLLALQRDAGNRAVAELIAQRKNEALTDEDKTLRDNGLTGNYTAWLGKLTTVKFLGQSVKVHPFLGDRLTTAASALATKTAPKGGWIDSTSALRGRGEGLHSFGLAIDLNPSANPQLFFPAEGAKEADDSNAEVQAALERAVLLVTAKPPAEFKWQERPGGTDHDQRVEASYDKVQEASEALKVYFTLDAKAKRAELEGHVKAAQPKDPLKRSADDWAAKIAADRRYVGAIAALIHWSQPQQGILNLSKDLVKAMTDSGGAGLTWLGDDAVLPGRDVMHFDTRGVAGNPIAQVWSGGRLVNLGDG